MCKLCGHTLEEISEPGIPRLRHRLQIPESIDFWVMLAAEWFEEEPSKITKDQRQEVKMKLMTVIYGKADFAKMEEQIIAIPEEDAQIITDWINEAATPVERNKRKGEAFGVMHGSQSLEDFLKVISPPD